MNGDREREPPHWVKTPQHGWRLSVQPWLRVAAVMLAVELPVVIFLADWVDQGLSGSSRELADGFSGRIPFGVWPGLGLAVLLVVVSTRLRAGERFYQRLIQGYTVTTGLSAALATGLVGLVWLASGVTGPRYADLDIFPADLCGRVWGLLAGALFVLWPGLHFVRSAARTRELRDARGPTAF